MCGAGRTHRALPRGRPRFLRCARPGDPTADRPAEISKRIYVACQSSHERMATPSIKYVLSASFLRRVRARSMTRSTVVLSTVVTALEPRPSSPPSAQLASGASTGPTTGRGTAATVRATSTTTRHRRFLLSVHISLAGYSREQRSSAGSAAGRARGTLSPVRTVASR